MIVLKKHLSGRSAVVFTIVLTMVGVLSTLSTIARGQTLDPFLSQPKRFHVQKIDIHDPPDSFKDAIVTNKLCGSGGCITRILERQRDGSYRKLDELLVFKIRPLNTSNNSYRDFLVTMMDINRKVIKRRLSYIGVGYVPTRQFQRLDRNKRYIYKMQVALAALGFDAGKRDGIMGSKTLNAFLKFLKDNRLPTEGGINEEYIERLFEVASNTINASNENVAAPLDFGTACVGDRDWCAAAEAEGFNKSERKFRTGNAAEVPNLQRYINDKYGIGAIAPEKIRVLLIDLDAKPDGKDEIILEVSGSRYCSVKGCTFEILKQQSNGWFYPMLSRAKAISVVVSGGSSDCQTAIQLGSKRYTSGDVIVEGVAYLFNGRKYVDSSTFYQQGGGTKGKYGPCPIQLPEIKPKFEITVSSDSVNRINAGQGKDELKRKKEEGRDDSEPQNCDPFAEFSNVGGATDANCEQQFGKD